MIKKTQVPAKELFTEFETYVLNSFPDIDKESFRKSWILFGKKKGLKEEELGETYNEIMNKRNAQDIYITNDLAIAAVIFTLNKKMIGVNREDLTGRITFKFENKKMCDEMEFKFLYGELLVNAREFKLNLDHLKNVIHQVNK